MLVPNSVESKSYLVTRLLMCMPTRDWRNHERESSQILGVVNATKKKGGVGMERVYVHAGGVNIYMSEGRYR